MKYPTLGVNVDHVATIRNARNGTYPDPVFAAGIAEEAGADQITVHLREDRRHIRERDVRILRETVQTRLNLEMAATEEMVNFALDVMPDMVTLVPERREEQTTEGGLDVVGQGPEFDEYCQRLMEAGIVLSLFIDPDRKQLDATRALGVPMVELHTGEYANAEGQDVLTELQRLEDAAKYGDGIGLVIAAGHGLDLKNVLPLTRISEIVEYNIGHSIVGRSIYVGFEKAVKDMIAALRQQR